MTVAALRALRDAGSLDPQCHYEVTDWVQGTTLTGPNTVQLHAVDASTLGMEARVFTPYDSLGWDGLFDVDQGTAGTMQRLTDNLGNTVHDSGDGASVGAFPWGLANWTENTVTDCTVTGWGAVTTGTVRRNRFTGATVNLTGAPAGAFIQDNEITASTVTVTATGATLTLANNDVRETANVTLNTTGNVTVLGAVIDGGTFAVTNGQAVSVQDTVFTGCTMTLAGAGGTATIINSALNAVTVSRNAACTGAVNFNGVRAETTQFQQGAGCTTGTLNIASSTLFLGIHKQNGNGNLSIGTSFIAVGNIVVNGTRGITVQRSHGTFNGNDTSLVSNRTGGTGVDVFTDVLFTRPTITLNGAVDPGAVQTIMNGGRIEFADLTVGDVAVGTVLQSTEITGQSIVNIQAGAGLHDRCRFAAGALYNSGAFTAQSCIVDGALTVTATANNINKLANKSFNDWV
jgi:hypothetical protein